MYKDNPQVTIVLVNYNGSEVTIECLKSLSEITYSNYKVIVVDNHSSDDSVKVLTMYQQSSSHPFHLITAQENNGFADGNNIGIQYALEQNADYVLLLNNDTVVERGFLEPLVEVLQEDSLCAATIGTIRYDQERDRIWYAGGSFSFQTGKTVHYHYNEVKPVLDKDQIEKVSFATGCCLCISSEFLKKHGLLTSDYFLYEEDTDYCIHIMSKGYHINYVPTSVIYHKISASTKSVTGLVDYYMVRNKFLLIRRHIKGSNKLTAYLYSYLMFIKRSISGEMSFHYTVKGILDFYRGIKGKRVF